MCDTQDGWVNTEDDNSGTWYYYEDGEVTTGWKDIKGSTYYFNKPGGSMGWSKEVDGKYLGPDGRQVKDERWVNTEEDKSGTWYYVGAHERNVTGWNKIGNDFYYFNYPGGSMTYNNTINGFDIDNDGKIVSGTGWLKDNYSGEDYYYSDGEMKTGWVKYGDSWYYMDDDGKMATGWRKVNGFWYYLHSDGEMATGWINDGEGWYYLYPQGSMASDTEVKGYLVYNGGKMVTGTGWRYIDNDWYFLKDDKVVNGWLKDKGYWYYLYGGGSMAHATWINEYYVDDNGKWIKDYKAEDDSLANSDGETDTLMACDTGDKNVDIAFTKWYDTIIPGKKYADDPRYSTISVAAFQNKLLYMSEQGEDVSELSADELDKLFEREMDDQANATLGMSGAADIIGSNSAKIVASEAVSNGAAKAGKLSMNQIDELIEEIGGSIKNHPLRQEYENAVKNLCNYEAELRAQGLSQKEIAETLYKARRDLGVKYKNLTPDALREYIYEVNMERYGDELGASFDFLVNKYSSQCENMDEVYEAIIKSSQRPNGNVDKLLQNFKEWLIKKNQ
ncbi:hypothetical protein [Clostridium sp. YIM B02500]|uniref:hypothetical protein n=1 Tax=Clostridium sp. YIM B02500 TaxID=2910681 RepID=UPI001EEF55D5|nr:hypothetical protein [Clostridium sp. YIM B02500]